MKIGFIGCVKFSKAALELIAGMSEDGIEISCVMTKSESVFNSDHVDLSSFCREKGIPFHFETGNHEDNLRFFSLHKPDVIYCFGWSHLLNSSMLALPPKGVVGFHPAALPANRGRHPLIWALVLGLKETGSSFFFMDEGADSGPIISQKNISIAQSDDAGLLYKKVAQVALEQIREFSLALLHNRVDAREQEHTKATYWRKRVREDGLIDWRMSAVDIYNLVRALSAPYPGAEFNYKGQLFKIDRVRVYRQCINVNIECGKVLDVDDNQFLVKCSGNSAVWVELHNCDSVPKTGEYL